MSIIDPITLADFDAPKVAQFTVPPADVTKALTAANLNDLIARVIEHRDAIHSGASGEPGFIFASGALGDQAVIEIDPPSGNVIFDLPELAIGETYVRHLIPPRTNPSGYSISLRAPAQAGVATATLNGTLNILATPQVIEGSAETTAVPQLWILTGLRETVDPTVIRWNVTNYATIPGAGGTRFGTLHAPQTIAGSGTIAATTAVAYQASAAGGTITLPVAPTTTTRRILILEAQPCTGATTVARSGADLINGGLTSYVLPGSGLDGGNVGAWIAVGNAGSWRVYGIARADGYIGSVGGAATTPVQSLRNVVGERGTFICSGSPEGAITANPSSTAYDRTNGAEYLKISGTGNTGWALRQRAESGTWTPISTAVTNVTTATPSIAMWMRTGNTVIVAGSIAMTLGSTGVFQVDISIPVASAFSASSDASGEFSGVSVFDGRSVANATDDRISLLANSNITNPTVRYLVVYRVL